ncbi:hypothetical protein A8A54_19360 [Brucella pseudogrignonensis]|uniref:SDR family oxidoreductase n=1 Tax=Brucella pseudogrignonensis TaxID=419475 RepID=UPI0007DA61F9|nr:SDR family oxidoreductase [Brucella pseudogrignonensis]ANG98761.1 hypothetical protein A8A54_19360 [Brucella pseudogrignonensis]
MKKTVVITGASSGIGRETAALFAKKGWNVVATMRTPEMFAGRLDGPHVLYQRLDVLDRNTIDATIAAALEHFGNIDVWVNNAGYGTFGPLEAATPDQIRRQFEVNLFGLIACIQAVAPHMREKGTGTIVNISSNGGLMTFPAYTLYNATKFAVEGLSEGLWYELGAFGIKVKLIEPGVTNTDFGNRSMDMIDYVRLPEYRELMDKITVARARSRARAGTADEVAQTILAAALDSSDRLRTIVGKDAARLWSVRRWLGSAYQMKMVRRMLGIQPVDRR